MPTKICRAYQRTREVFRKQRQIKRLEQRIGALIELSVGGGASSR